MPKEMRIGGGDHKVDDEQNNFMSRDKKRRHHFLSCETVKATLLFVVIVLTCFILNQSNYSTQLTNISHPSSVGILQSKVSPGNKYLVPLLNDQLKSEIPTPYVNDKNLELESTLKRAAMKDQKTVIITTINAAWTEPNSLFDLFLESFRIGNQTQGLLKHLVVVALDQKAYSRCLEVHFHCFALATDDDVEFSAALTYMRGSYLKMMWRRVDFLRSVLEMGYNFVFSDADIMWLRDPFPRFYPDGDFQIACEIYKFNSTNLRNYANGGFIYAKSNSRTIRFYKFWLTSKDFFPGTHEQDMFEKIKVLPFVSEIGVRIRFLDTAYFGGFCEPSEDLGLVVTMHANCCGYLKNKIHDITLVLEDWKKFMALAGAAENQRNLSGIMTWTVPRKCPPLRSYPKKTQPKPKQC